MKINKIVQKIILLGPPGSGKNTQSMFIQRDKLIEVISYEDILHNTIFDTKKFGMSAIQNIEYENVINDPIITHFIEKSIKRKKCFNNFLINSFPKTLLQAQEIENKNIFINCIIELKMSKKIIYQRLLNDKINNYHQNNHQLYSTNMKDIQNINNNTENLSKDNHIKNIHNKILEYIKNRKMIMDFYKKKIRNNTIQHYTVNANNDINTVYKRIKKFLKYKKK